MTKRTHVLHIEPQEGLSIEEVQLLNYNRAPNRRHVTDAFCWAECFQGSAPLSPLGKQSPCSPPACISLKKSPLQGPALCSVAPVCSSSCSRSIQPLSKNTRKKSNGHSCTPLWGRRGTTRAHANFCSGRIFTMLYGRYFLSAVVHEEPKSSFFRQISQREWNFASGITEIGPQDLACQPRAKVQAEILFRIAQELPLKKQPHNETTISRLLNIAASIYSPYFFFKK